MVSLLFWLRLADKWLSTALLVSRWKKETSLANVPQHSILPIKWLRKRLQTLGHSLTLLHRHTSLTLLLTLLLWSSQISTREARCTNFYLYARTHIPRSKEEPHEGKNKNPETNICKFCQTLMLLWATRLCSSTLFSWHPPPLFSLHKNVQLRYSKISKLKSPSGWHTDKSLFEHLVHRLSRVCRLSFNNIFPKT